MASRLKQALAAGRLVRVFGLGQLCHPKLVEMVGLAGGFDAVWLDQEHAGLTVEQDRAGRAGRPRRRPRLVRAPGPHRLRHGHAAAGGRRRRHHGRPGAQRPPGRGGASPGPSSPRAACAASTASAATAGFGTVPLADYLRRANEDTFVAIQIEHADAVADVEQHRRPARRGRAVHRPRRPGQSMGLAGRVGPSAPVAGGRARRRRGAGRRHRTGPSCRPTPPTPGAASTWAAGCCRSASTSGPSPAASAPSRRICGVFQGLAPNDTGPCPGEPRRARQA